jgi:hypothetical protein
VVGVELRITGREVDLNNADLSPFVGKIGLPASGKGFVDISMTVPLVEGRRDWSRADGSVALSCKNCQIGDDNAKLTLGKNSGLIHDIPFSHLAFRSLEVALSVKSGVVELTKWSADSDDIRLDLKLNAKLALDLERSVVQGCVRYRGTDLLEKRDRDLSNLVKLIGGQAAADGMFNVQLGGRLNRLRKVGRICAPTPLESLTEEEYAAAAGATAAFFNSRGTDTDDMTSVARDPKDSPDSPLVKLFDETIKIIDDSHIEIKQRLFDEVSKDIAGIATGARVVPTIKDGKAVGFKVYAMKPDSLYARLGLRNGDTIERINGKELSTLDQALAAYEDARKAKKFVIEILRSGKPLTITYTVE